MKTPMEFVTRYMQEANNVYAKSFDLYMNSINALNQNQEEMMKLYQASMNKLQEISQENQKIAENLIKQAKDSQMQLKGLMAETMDSAMTDIPVPSMDSFKEFNAKIVEMMQFNK